MRRRGWTLIEMLISICVGTIVMSCSVLVLGLVLHTNRISQQQAYATSVVGRLNIAFRQDVHDSSLIASTGEKKKQLAMDFANHGRVVYGVVPEGVVRRDMSGDKITHEQLFRLPDNLAIDFEVDARTQPNAARLRIRSDERAGLNMVIEAVSSQDEERTGS